MSGDGGVEPTVIHLAGWSVVRLTAVPRDLDALVRPLVGHGDHVAVDLTRAHAEPDSIVEALVRLQRLATDVGGLVVVVEPDAVRRTALYAAGVIEVHESLDDASHDSAPALHDDASTSLPPRLGVGDTVITAAEDLLGRGSEAHPD